MSVCFVDTETTGLDPDRHTIWEVGLITPNGDEHVWQFPIVELEADPFALDIGRYWQRHWQTDIREINHVDAIFDAHKTTSRRINFPNQGRSLEPSALWARYFQKLTAGHHLAGAVVSFDEERLRKLLRRHGVLPRWHYHLIDVENLAAGALALEPPWDSTELSNAVDIDPNNFHRHTALGDARWAKAIYESVMNKGEQK